MDVTSPRLLIHEIAEVVRYNRGWMTWNLVLAFVPSVLAGLLLWRPHRRTPAWWVGIAVFTLFLPNAPYVITDLIHLREHASLAPTRSAVVFGVLPLYAAFIVAGYTSYLFCLEMILREVRSLRPRVRRAVVEVPVHLVCALGIVLGRIARLNSWDTVQDPRWTVERTYNTLTWSGAPFAFVATFLAIWLTSTVLRVVYQAIGRSALAVRDEVRARFDTA